MKVISPELAEQTETTITKIECFTLLAPDFDPTLTSSAQDSFLIVIHASNGVYGVGESDANPWMLKACVEARGTHTMGLSLHDLLIGQNPFRIGQIWKQLYIGSAMNGRRGIVIHAIGAIEMALWDLCGKSTEKPVHELLGGATKSFITPYASLQPRGKSFEEYRDALVESAETALAAGFKAVKTEVTMNGPYAHDGLKESYERHTEVIACVRKALGDAVDLMVDVQYLWEDSDTCLSVIQDWKQFNLKFLETPIWSDNLSELAKVVNNAPMPIASGEWLSTRYEFEALMDVGMVNIAQPDVGRVGGLGEAKIVCEMAQDRGLAIVPHCWKTGVSISATAHLAFTVGNCEFIEYLPPRLCTERLRRELATDDLELINGRIALPKRPGLGIEVDWNIVESYSVM